MAGGVGRERVMESGVSGRGGFGVGDVGDRERVLGIWADFCVAGGGVWGFGDGSLAG